MNSPITVLVPGDYFGHFDVVIEANLNTRIEATGEGLSDGQCGCIARGFCDIDPNFNVATHPNRKAPLGAAVGQLGRKSQ